MSVYDEASVVSQPMPAHIETTVQAIAKLHTAHYRRATRLQKIVDRMAKIVGHPSFIGALTCVVIGWIGGNLFLERVAHWSFDQPAFPWLQGAGELAALYITALILMSQRRKDELSELREQLTLELATLTEQKSAKIIALLEEMRRDSPHLIDRRDSEAEDMAMPVDPGAVLEAFQETHIGMMAEEEDDV